MSKKCDICGKRPQVGHNVSHSNIKTKTRWMPNLQKVRAKIGNNVKKIQACTRCIRSGKVEKAV